jgi:protein-tyrosine phosphatase
MRQVLFVCTGNVFRSLTAEYALRAALKGRADIAVASAGTEDYAHTVMPEIREYLLSKGLDVSTHRRRTLTQAMVEDAHLVVAMSVDHRDFIRERFGRSVPLFLQCCGHAPEALLDLHEAVLDHRTNKAAALTYLRSAMDRIVELAPLLARRLEELLKAPAASPAAQSSPAPRR